MEVLSFDAFNEEIPLIESIENYRRRFRVYPKVVIADKIYRNNENLKFCKEHGIRISGPPLVRPPKDENLIKEQRRQERKDMSIRNTVERKFGEGKRFYGLERVMASAHLQETSETVIAVQVLVMNRIIEIPFNTFIFYFIAHFFTPSVLFIGFITN